ncbi:MAG: LPS export ABC transporter periplasmic protein LptC [bacterium]
MESRKRYALLIFVVLGLAAGGYYYWSGTDNSSSTPEEKNGPSVKQEVTEFHLTETTGPDERWILHSPRARRQGKNIKLSRPVVKLIQSSDTIAKIRGDSGTYNMSTAKLVLRGSVFVHYVTRDIKLRTKILNWDRSNGIIKTDADVRIRSSMGSLHSSSLWADLAREIIRFQSSQGERLRLRSNYTDTSFQ